MEWLRIANWEKWQSYRKDREQPPWIKVHRRLLRHPDWVARTDSQKGQLVSIWMLAADREGEIPDDPKLIRKLCQMESSPDLNLFISLGFIERRHNDANVTPERRQNDAPEESRGEKRRGDSRAACQRGAKTPPEDFIQSLKNNPAYKSIDIDRELAKIDAWLQTPKGRRRQKTKGFILNWLNRIDVPIRTQTKAEALQTTDNEAWRLVLQVAEGKQLRLDEITRRAAEAVGWEKIKGDEMDRSLAQAKFFEVRRHILNKENEFGGRR